MNEEQIEQVVEGVPKEALGAVWVRLTSEVIKQGQYRQALESLREESPEDFDEFSMMVSAVVEEEGSEEEEEEIED